MIRILVKMVVINHRDWVDALEAYSTAPLTLEMNRTVQHGFYNGTYARFGDLQVTVTIHDHPEFHGKSHYDLRNLLDSEGMEDDFIVVDETTPDLDALWYVLPTGYEMDRVKPGDIVHYPGEDPTFWHVHIQTADVPYKVFGWREGCHPVSQALAQYDYLKPYDPHDPQDRLITSNIDWTNPEVSGSIWGLAFASAISGTEVEWSTDKALCQQSGVKTATICARLTAKAARKSGLLQYWSYQGRIIPPGGEVFLQAPYDTKSPIWPTGYPDESTSRIGSNFKDRSGPRFGPEARPRRKDVLRLSSARQRAQQSLHHNACRRVDSNRSSR